MDKRRWIPEITEATVHELNALTAEKANHDDCRAILKRIHDENGAVTDLMAYTDAGGTSPRCALCILYRVIELQMQRDDQEKLLSDVNMKGDA